MSIRLTQTVKKGGCAAKLPAGTLKSVLSGIQGYRPKELLVGFENLDDACVYRLGDGRVMIQTLDFFTPIVDDPYDFGVIATTNALSDVYAMGGTPALALSILAFPTQTLPIEILTPLMKGATDQLIRAKTALAGGHTIDDDTLKFGLSVTGFAPENRVWTNAGSRPGDVLILTKGLGTGTLSSAIKNDEASPEWAVAAIQSMSQLNCVPELIKDVKVHAATDITGFGLAGHAWQMATASGVQFEFWANRIPSIHGALDAIRAESLNRAHYTNREYAGNALDFKSISDETFQWLVFDAQTSGGLLLSIPERDAENALGLIRAQFPLAQIVGRALKAGSEAKPISFRADGGR